MRRQHDCGSEGVWCDSDVNLVERYLECVAEPHGRHDRRAEKVGTEEGDRRAHPLGDWPVDGEVDERIDKPRDASALKLRLARLRTRRAVQRIRARVSGCRAGCCGRLQACVLRAP
jgi:hypothetical protein